MAGSVVSAVYFFWNSCHRQGKTGQSIGKTVFEFTCISAKTWQPIGFWLSFAPQLAHHLDQSIFYIGYPGPPWDDQRQTLADEITSTVCVPVDQPASPLIPPAAEHDWCVPVDTAS